MASGRDTGAAEPGPPEPGSPEPGSPEPTAVELSSPGERSQGPRRAGPRGEAEARPTAADDLVAELEAYDRARSALNSGRYEEAVARLRAYLETRPFGRLRLEARLDLVEALIRLDAPKEALPVAEALLDDPGAASRREELTRVVVELKAAVGDCRGARALLPAQRPDLLEAVQKCEDGGG